MGNFKAKLGCFAILTLQLITEIICVGHASHDETLVEKAQGKDVVESVIRKIAKSNIFKPDHSFLIRLAFIETRFGTDDKTFRSGYYGGIWQVDKSVFISTQSNSPELNEIHTAIEKFNIKWKDVTWDQLLKPLYSGLAAAIHFSTRSTPIPDRIDQQADFWIKNFRSDGTPDRFIKASEELRNLTKCRGKMDLIIVLDSSGSIGSNHYKIALDFVATLINSFTLDHTRIGMLIYSRVVEVIFPLQSNLSIAEMVNLAENAEYMYDGTNTHLGILEAVKIFSETGSNEGVPQIMIVFTDGDSNDKKLTMKAVAVSEAAGITSMSVGIGKDISDEELETIALNNPKHMFRLSHFLALKDFLFTITEVACEEPQVVDPEKTYYDTLVKNETRPYNMKLPKEGITVIVNVTEGAVEGYWSKYEEVPSKAVHDGKISGPTFIPGDEKKRRRRDDSMLDEPTVYISIRGLQEINNYTFTSEIGNTVPPSDSIRIGGNSFDLAWKCLLALVVTFCIIK